MENCVLRAECDNCKELYDQKIDKCNQKIDSVNHRVNTLEDNFKQIQSLTIAVEKMGLSLEHMGKELAEQGKRLLEIETEPAKKWKQIVSIGSTVFITAILTYILSHMGF